MQIRKLSHQEIEIVVEYLQAMLDDMTSFGSHYVFQDSDSGSNWLRDCIQQQIDSPDHLFLGIQLDAASSQLIGIIEASIANLLSVYLPKSSLHIHAIYVVPTYRRSGVARSLFEAAFQWGRDKGCTEVDLHVLQNSPAKSLYEGLGFEAFQIEMRRKL
ncbi:GNAT family N-acetyltransferase [Nostoc sp. FACHB-280]|uniref:GNAT family N-acetyltransferase n=1 Tax=Nostoc sp. FACHB-280 TaxID=2692839 RepID=UPI00168B3CE1|nr:GNAT family N-acetyltransferase [Nostoc sp. FACHB-280]MBD2495420.1 GNAT family N-acetyltransferase [Nostoc sp. FACHB-280]